MEQPSASQPPFFAEACRPTPIAGAFLGTCVTALHRGVALGDLLDAIVDSDLSGPWVTWAELNRWVETVNELEPRDDVPCQEWLDYCTANRVDPITGAEIVLRAVVDEMARP